MEILEPEAKKLAPDPLLGLRGQPGLGDPTSLRGPPQASSPPHGIGGGLSGNCVEDIRVPDKMVGLSEYLNSKEKRKET